MASFKDLHCIPRAGLAIVQLPRPSATLVDEGQRFWATHVAGLEAVKSESGIVDQSLDRPVKMATTPYTSPGRSQTVLPPPHIRLRRTAMFDKEEPSGRLEDPTHFAKRTSGI
jgi:hypothetical protein